MICPVCRGSKLRYDDDTGSWGPASCPACNGSGIGPEGNQSRPETLDKFRAALAAVGSKPRSNGRVPWSVAEDEYVLDVETRWRKSLKARNGSHKPEGWYEKLALALHDQFPEQPLRTRHAVKQRIMRLAPTVPKG